MPRQSGTRVQVQCCDCRRFRVDNEWRRGGAGEYGGMLSHGLCPQCYDRALAALQQYDLAHAGELMTVAAIA